MPADRLPRALVSQGFSLAAGISQALTAFTVLTGTATVPPLIVLGVVNGALAAVFRPASSAIGRRPVDAVAGPGNLRESRSGAHRM